MSPPDGLRPMLAVTASRLPADASAWAAEVKWDGYRALCLRDDAGLRLRSRRGTDMAPWFPELAGLAGDLRGHRVVLDGEVVAIGADGRPSFEALQRRMGSRGGRRPPAGGQAAYMLFDLLWLDGEPRTALPWAQRRRLLEALELAGPAWHTTAAFPGQEAAELLAATAAQELEGIVLKRLDSPYRPGRRSADWRKLLHYQTATFVVGGFLAGPDGVAALLVGTPDPGAGGLRFAGRVDHGLIGPARRRLAELLAPRISGASPFGPAGLDAGRWGRPAGAAPTPVFVRPELLVRVRHRGWEAGRLRHASYYGLG